MTPAINAARRAGIRHTIHSYEHDKAAASYGEEAADKLGLSPARVFKTLLAQIDGKELVVAVVPVAYQLHLKQLASALDARSAEMARPADAERATGYVVGGISPLGQKKRLRTVIDESACMHPTIYVSAGRRGLEIELAAADLAGLTQARFAAIAR
ncbi:MAG: Cys-tRNA(Pro) deacylase [Pseudomonadota bacterium]